MALFRTDPAESLRTAHRFSRSIAGAESNVAIGLSRLGFEARLSTMLRQPASWSGTLTPSAASTSSTRGPGRPEAG